jgi:hypothetical protein
MMRESVADSTDDHCSKQYNPTGLSQIYRFLPLVVGRDGTIAAAILAVLIKHAKPTAVN